MVLRGGKWETNEREREKSPQVKREDKRGKVRQDW